MSAQPFVTSAFGAVALASGGVRFRLYAPSARSAVVVLDAPVAERNPMVRDAFGFFESVVPAAMPGSRYFFEIDGLRAPDPASRFQPEGVHGPSVVVDPAAYRWQSTAWTPRPWPATIFYELHLGTFTPEGTFAAASARLPALVDLGITALQIMPIAEAPGARNWGYDGVLPFAPSHNYGTPDELRALVDRAHALGLAVYLDVVYNHFGPEGNYLHAYAPEFYTDRHATPWGPAIDVEPPERADVRAFFIENAVYWLSDFRFDGLRLDAVHAIHDGDDRSFLRELARTVRARVDRDVALVLENEDNESALLEAGFRAQWNDDSHHAAHVIATHERDGYYADYASEPIAFLGRTITSGFGYQGEPSAYRGARRRGDPSAHLPLTSFVNFVQNHDQIGNRPFGDRIATLASSEALRAVVAVILLAPPVPMLFMGEEWGASTPFLYFCDFEPELALAVTHGRRTEFAPFFATADGAAGPAIPDPSAPETFASSALRWDERERPPHRAWYAFYRELLHVRSREIVPRIARVTGRNAQFTTFGTTRLRATWRLDDASILGLEANLGATRDDGFRPVPGERIVFATHAPDETNRSAAPWSVRWTIE